MLSTLPRRPAAASHAEIPDQLYPLTELPGRAWMPRKNGKTLSRFTVIRWAIHGTKGRRLKTIMVGGQRCCCDAWAMSFFEALAGNEQSKTASHAGSRDHEDAEAELAREGFGT